MPVDQTKVHSTIVATTKLLLDAGITGEEYLLVLQTLVAHVLVANDLGVKRIWLANLNADVRARRIAQLEARKVAN